MGNVAPFHTSESATPAVLHNNSNCSEGNKIKPHLKVIGTGSGRSLCKVCAGLG
jgi:hypothetical protein